MELDLSLVGENIRRGRKRLSLNQTELGRRMGFSQQQVQRDEAGRSPAFEAVELLNYAAQLGIDPMRLAGFDSAVHDTGAVFGGEETEAQELVRIAAGLPQGLLRELMETARRLEAQNLTDLTRIDPSAAR